MTELILALLILVSPTTQARRAEVVAIGEAIEQHATAAGFDPWSLAAVVVRESNARCDVVGKLGERGAAQVIPHYVKMSASDIATPEGSIKAAVIALQRWKRAKPKADVWQCYASGNACAAGRSVRLQRRIKRKLKTLVKSHAAGVHVWSSAAMIAGNMQAPENGSGLLAEHIEEARVNR